MTNATLTDADRAYDNNAAIAGAEEIAARWTRNADAFRKNLGPRARMALPYGATQREAFDLFSPEEDAPRGLLFYVHGGYWRARSRGDFSHLAAGALAHGWAVAMPSYTLAPEARISRMSRQVMQALGAAADAVPEGPIRVAGHSAGGHLAARLFCADAMLTDVVRERLAGGVMISPLSDLRPLVPLALNADLNLTEDEARAESPALQPKLHPAPLTVWVGGSELPAFLDQSRWLAEAWNVPWVADPGRHHLDVIDDLARHDSPLTQAVVGG